MLAFLFLDMCSVGHASNPWGKDRMCADWVEKEYGKAKKECYCQNHDPGAGDSPFGDYGQTAANGLCMDGDTAVYCTCAYEQGTCTDGGSNCKAWECQVATEEKCMVGTPPCKYGKCKDLSQACGNSPWSLDPTSLTCQTIFTAANDTGLKASCEDVFSNQPICPSSVVVSDYLGWADFMSSADKTRNAIKAAALDTVWFYDKLKTMVNTSFATDLDKNLTANSSGLKTTKISKHFKAFRDFSCLRNLPQCKNDARHTEYCEDKCADVTTSIESWRAECANFKSSHRSIKCEPLGYERDCDNTLGDAAGAWPGLCVAFQNEPLRGVSSDTISYSVTFALAVAAAKWL